MKTADAMDLIRDLGKLNQVCTVHTYSTYIVRTKTAKNI